MTTTFVNFDQFDKEFIVKVSGLFKFSHDSIEEAQEAAEELDPHFGTLPEAIEASKHYG